MRPLVIGYGSPIRGDDAAGLYVAQRLAETLPPDSATILARHQLMPEVALPISQASLVFFVDASSRTAPGEVSQARLVACDLESFSTHRIDARSLLRLSRQLYGRRPKAVMFGIGAQRFDLGTELSPRVRAACETVARVITQLIERHGARRKGALHA